MIEFVSLKEQYKNIKKEIDEAISRVLERQWFILGPELEAFEREFAAFCNAPFALGVNSGTDALVLSLRARNIGFGDEVITVPNTAIPTVAAIRETGATPVFADIEEDTFLIDVESLKRKITPKTKAVIPVHLYGNSCALDAIQAVTNAHNVVLIEDACQAHGAQYKNKGVGTFGDFGCFSFYPSKNLGGYGDGGMIVCKSNEDYQTLKRLRNYGQSTRYVCEQEGKNSRLDELQAAILRVKMKYLSEWNEQRRRVAHLYKKYITAKNVVLPVETVSSEHVFHLFVIRCRKRDALKKFLEENGVKSEIHYPIPIYRQKGYEFLGLSEGTCPVAEKVMNEILSIPLYPELTEEQARFVSEQINVFGSGI